MWFGNRRLVRSLQEELTELRHERKLALDIVQLIEDKDFEKNTQGHLSTESVFIDKLLQLRDNLAEYNEQDVQNNWVSNGLTKISFLFEDGSKNIQSILDKILSDLVKYMGANQGALYLVNREDESDIHLETASVYAYGKKKYVNQKIDKTEGLVGQAFQEGSYIYMTDVPKDYVKITSGLGEATPQCIFIIPLKTRTHTIGVLELAFFKRLLPYQINFLEKISENLANAIFLVQSANNNAKLLHHSQLVTEQLQVKESELLKHVNELTEIQNNLNAKNNELEHAKLEIEARRDELERVKQAEYELIESKIKTQRSIHELMVKKLNAKITELEEKLKNRVFVNLLN